MLSGDLAPRERPFGWFPRMVVRRAGGLACGWPQLGISLAAVCVFWAGLGLLQIRYPAESRQTLAVDLLDLPGAEDEEQISPTVAQEAQRLAPQFLTNSPWTTVADPLRELMWRDVFSRTLLTSETKTVGWILNLAWALAVWSLFGVAICRATVVQLTTDRAETFPQTVRFAWSRVLSTIGAPLIPAGGMLSLWVGLVLLTWLGRVPFLGEPVLYVFSPLIFLGAVAFAFLGLVILYGWPLMVATMGVEDCDGFGALSRTFSFLTGRPLSALWNAGISFVYGTVLTMLLGGLFMLALLAQARPIGVNVGDSAAWRGVLSGSHFSAQLLFASFSVSLFWTLAALNYVELRRIVDGKPFDEIAPGVDEPAPSGLPVVGIAATEFRPSPVSQASPLPATAAGATEKEI